jgi:lysophospholipase L1-like esterase
MQRSSALFLGDSIVKGVSFINGRYKTLQGSFYNRISESAFRTTVNRGRFGLTSERFLSKIDNLRDIDHDVLFFEIGGNDCNFKWEEIADNPEGKHFPAVSKEQFTENLYRIYDVLKGHGKKTIAMNMPPLHAEKFFDFLSVRLSPNNILKWLKNISKIYYHHESYNNIFETVTRNCGVELIDIRNQFLLEDNLGTYIGVDGMHPTEEGHELIYHAINRYLIAV